MNFYNICIKTKDNEIATAFPFIFFINFHVNCAIVDTLAFTGAVDYKNIPKFNNNIYIVKPIDNNNNKKLIDSGRKFIFIPVLVSLVFGFSYRL